MQQVRARLLDLPDLLLHGGWRGGDFLDWQRGGGWWRGGSRPLLDLQVSKTASMATAIPAVPLSDMATQFRKTQEDTPLFSSVTATSFSMTRRHGTAWHCVDNVFRHRPCCIRIRHLLHPCALMHGLCGHHPSRKSVQVACGNRSLDAFAVLSGPSVQVRGLWSRWRRCWWRRCW